MADRKKRDISGFEPPEARFSPGEGKNYLLAIGIDKYRHFTPLHNAVKDIQDIVRLLTTEYQFSANEPLCRILCDGEATRRRIITELKALRRKAQPSDRVLILYSGHGYLDPDTKLGYWIPVDGEEDEEATFIPNSTIRDSFKVMKSRHSLLISDSCFSGSLLVRGLDRKGETGAFAKWEAAHSRYLFCSGKGIVSDGKKGENSPFAQQLIKHLSDPNIERINIARLADEVTKSVRFNYIQNAEANPFFNAGHDGGQFIFYRSTSPSQKEEIAFREAMVSRSEKKLRQFLKSARLRAHKHAVRQRLRTMEQQRIWQKLNKKSFAALDEFIDEHPDHPKWDEAIRLRDRVEEEEEEPVKIPGRKKGPTQKPRIQEIPEGPFTLDQLKKLYVPQLREIAKKKGIRQLDKMKKLELVFRIYSLQAEIAEPVPEKKSPPPRPAKAVPRSNFKLNICQPEAFRQLKGSELKTIARKLKMPQFDHLTKAALIEEILRHPDTTTVWSSGKRVYVFKQKKGAETAAGSTPKKKKSPKSLPKTLPHPVSPFRLQIHQKDSFHQLKGPELKEIARKMKMNNYDNLSKVKLIQEILHHSDTRVVLNSGGKVYTLIDKSGAKPALKTKAEKPAGRTQKKPARRVFNILDNPLWKHIYTKEEGRFKDPRDGQVYKTIKLRDGKIWMAENLNYKSGIALFNTLGLNRLSKNFFPSKDDEKCGQFYSYVSAKLSCPTGWRLPTDEEWIALARAYGGYRNIPSNINVGDSAKAYRQLIEGGSSGFSAQTCGYLSGTQDLKTVVKLGMNLGLYWSDSQDMTGRPFIYEFDQKKGLLLRKNFYSHYQLSVRCVKK